MTSLPSSRSHRSIGQWLRWLLQLSCLSSLLIFGGGEIKLESPPHETRYLDLTLNSIPAVQAKDSLSQRMADLKQSTQRWIEVNLSTQRLIAWEGGTPVYAVIVSTGTAEHPTLVGSFAIQSRLRTARMQGDDYDVPDVPYTMYYDGNYAIHGAYWHHSFGTPVSHGCVNVAVNHAEWLFNWASVGTPVVVHY